MVLVDSDLQLVKSAHTVGNINSLGGDMTDTPVSESIESLWDEIKSSELSSSVVGEYEVRCIYVRNFSLNNETMQQVQVWIEQNTVSPFTDIDIGVGTAQVGDSEQTVANEDTLPDNIGWTFARGEENAEFLGDIETGKGKSIWIRRHAGPTKSDSSYPSDNYILRFKFLRTGALSPGPGPGPGPDPGLDPFGIRMIYKTQTSGDVSAPFFMNMNDPYSDCRFNTTTGSVATKNGDGSWGLGPSPRIRLYTSLPGCARDIYDVLLDTYDHDIWGERGYMKAPNDWKNVEITGYFKVVSVDPANTSERKLYLYSRTFRHNTGVGGGCSGTAYKGVIYGGDQVLKFHKEAFHDGSQPCGDRNIVTVTEGIPRTDNNTWFGFKVMMWNYPNPANPNIDFVHLEIWLDLSNSNTWEKMAERNDTGGWYPGMPSTTCPGDENCGGHQDQIIKWGGPTTEIRWDAGYTSVHFKNLSCREIIPGTSVSPSPSPSPPPPPGPGPGPSPPPPGPGTDAFGISQIYASKVGGDSWASTLWNNGVTRNINAPSVCTAESQDSRLRLSPGSNRIDIDGAGTMKASTSPTSAISAPRVPISGTWQNVEQSVYLRLVTGSTAYVQLRCKAEHECEATNDQFGGYILYVDFINQSLYFKKEKSHNIGYSARLFEKAVTLAANTYYGFKTICYNVGSGVKLEAYMDTTQGANGGTWVKQIEGADTGAWIGSPDTQVCSQSTIRTDLEAANSSVEYKWWSIREIDTAIVPAPPPPPGPPPGPSPPPPPPTPPPESLDTFGILMLNPTKSGGKTWFSTAWASNGNRLLSEGNLDPFDSKFQYLNGDPDTTKLQITGVAGGEAKVTEFNTSTRMMVKDTWLNTEMTIYQWIDSADTTATDIQLRARSRHETACSFGNYLVKYRDSVGNTLGESEDRYSQNEVEVLHPIYKRDLNRLSLPTGIPKGQWVGFKFLTRTITASGNVKCESFINYNIANQTTSDWVTCSSFEYTGTNVDIVPGSNQSIVDGCVGSGDNVANNVDAATKYTGTGNLAWIRSNNTTSAKWKFFSVREIDPL